MNRNTEIALLAAAILLGLIFTVAAWRQTASGGDANNGLSNEWGMVGDKGSEPAKASDEQLARAITAKESGDYKAASEIMIEHLTPAQRVRRAEQIERKEARGREMTTRTRAILGDEEFNELMKTKKRLARAKKASAAKGGK